MANIQKRLEQIKKKREDAALQKRMSDVVNRYKNNDVFKPETTVQPQKAVRNPNMGKNFIKNAKKSIAQFVSNQTDKLSSRTKKRMLEFALYASLPVALVAGMSINESNATPTNLDPQTAMFANQVDTVAHVQPQAVVDSLSNQEVITLLENKLRAESLTITNIPSQEQISDLAAEQLAQMMIEDGHNTLADFDLSGRQFSAEELQMIQPGALSTKIANRAMSTVGRKRCGGYCLAGVRQILGGLDIKLDANNSTYRSAYQAAEPLSRHPDFVEIDFNIRDIYNAPDGMVGVKLPGTGATRHGHIFFKNGNFDLSDGRQTLRNHLDKLVSAPGGSRVAGVYKDLRSFVTTDCTLSPELIKTMLLEDRAKERLVVEVMEKHEPQLMAMASNGIDPYIFWNMLQEQSMPPAFDSQYFSQNKTADSVRTTDNSLDNSLASRQPHKILGQPDNRAIRQLNNRSRG